MCSNCEWYANDVFIRFVLVPEWRHSKYWYMYEVYRYILYLPVCHLSWFCLLFTVYASRPAWLYLTVTCRELCSRRQLVHRYGFSQCQPRLPHDNESSQHRERWTDLLYLWRQAASGRNAGPLLTSYTHYTIHSLDHCRYLPDYYWLLRRRRRCQWWWRKVRSYWSSPLRPAHRHRLSPTRHTTTASGTTSVSTRRDESECAIQARLS